MENPSLLITACHHMASLVMPNGDPLDGFFYPTFTKTHYRFPYYLHDKGLPGHLEYGNYEISPMLKEILNQ